MEPARVPFPQSTVTSFMRRNRERLEVSWKTFDPTGFRGQPRLPEESEADRELRMAITRDVYMYVDASVKNELLRTGQMTYEQSFAPPAYISFKAHAFLQTLAFMMYTATIRKRAERQSRAADDLADDLADEVMRLRVEERALR